MSSREQTVLQSSQRGGGGEEGFPGGGGGDLLLSPGVKERGVVWIGRRRTEQRAQASRFAMISILLNSGGGETGGRFHGRF